MLRKGKDFGVEFKELFLKVYDNFVVGRKVFFEEFEELIGFIYYRVN